MCIRDRIDLLFDKDSFQQEIGLLVAYDEYKGQAPAAAVVTCLLYTSDAADERSSVDLGGRRIIKKQHTLNRVRAGNIIQV